MRKKLSLILILALVVILAASLFACNRDPQEKQPPKDDITPVEETPDLEGQADRIVLNFSMPSFANSVFNAVYISDFDLSKVNYKFVYLAEDGSEISSKEMGHVTEDMVDAEDLPLLKQAGKHTVHVTATLESKKQVKGSFDIRLKEDGVQLNAVQFRFRLRENEKAFFGRPVGDGSSHDVVTDVDEGTQFENWTQFAETFRFVKRQYALIGVKFTQNNASVTLDNTGKGFPFTVGSSDYTFELIWTADTAAVEFHLNLPADAILLPGATDPRLDKDVYSKIEPNDYFSVTYIPRNVAVPKPDTDSFNCFSGLYFAGWYQPKYNEQGGLETVNGQVETDTIWEFSKAINSDIKLYAKWVEHSYSYTVYPMGGKFGDNIAPSAKDGTTITKENYKELGYTLLTSSTQFTNAGALLRVSFEGFNYGDNYTDYVAEVTVTDGETPKKVMLTFADIVASPNRIFVKNCYNMTGMCSDYICTQPYSHSGDSGKVVSDRVGYIGWAGNAGETDALMKRLFDMTVKADGTVRIDATKDNSVNVIKLPAEVNFDGTVRPLTEIGDRAMSNLKALREVDLSDAINLTTVGKEAFAFDSNFVKFTEPKENNNITLVGKDAFINTALENNYKGISGLDFFIVNKVIYKYTGTPGEDGILDLTGDYYTLESFSGLEGLTVTQEDVDRANAQLRSATHIMGGAFEDAKTLKEIRLDGVFQYIEAEAFANLDMLEKLTVPAENALTYVSEDAFNDCDKFLSADSGNYNSASGAILIGNIYYCLVDRTRTSAEVPASYKIGEADYPINIIAPRAFYACEKLTEVTFGNEGNINSVGADAFHGTPFAETQGSQNLVIVNGILAEFYGPTAQSVIIPAEVKEIGEDAFGDYARNLETIIFENAVTKFGAYAFKGANNLKGIIMSSAVNVDGDKLVGAPSLEPTTFATVGDEMSEDLKLYFSGAVMKKLKELKDKQVADNVTALWVELFKLNESNFEEEVIASVSVRANRIVTSLLDASDKALDAANAKKLFTDYYQNPETQQKLLGALEVTNNSGIGGRFVDLDISLLTFTPCKEQDPNKTCTKFVLGYDHPIYKDVFPKEGGDDAVVVSFYKAIKGNPSATSTFNYNDYSSKGNNNMWFSGDLAGKTDSGRNLPVFFTTTSKSKLSIKFNYIDCAGATHSIDIDATKIAGFVLEQETPINTVTVEVDFYGVCTYKFTYRYSSRKPRYETIEQADPISVPLNGNAASILRGSKLLFTREDGNVSELDMSSQYYFTFSGTNGGDADMATGELGRHKVRVAYNNTSECVNDTRLECEVTYTVVLQATPSDFEYKYKNGAFDEGDTHYDGEATIVKYKNRNAVTVIIPETCTVEQGGETKLYKVVRLGEITAQNDSQTGVFADFPNLQTVYLSSNLRAIAAGTFSNCQQLANVRTAIASSSTEQTVNREDFEILDRKVRGTSSDGKEVIFQYVCLNRLGSYTAFDDYNALAIPAEFSLGDKDEKSDLPIIYRVTKLQEGLKLPKNNNSRPVYLYIPSTVFGDITLKTDDDQDVVDGEEGYNIIFYENGRGRFVVSEEISTQMRFIGNNAFYNCSNLTSIQFAENSDNLVSLGVGAFSRTGLTEIDLSMTAITEVNNNLFENCASLKSVKFNAGKITGIGSAAFRGCYMLHTIDGLKENSNLEFIADHAFDNCRSLEEIKLGKNVTTIEDEAFGNCIALIIYCDFASNDEAPLWLANLSGSGCTLIFSDGLAENKDKDGNKYITQAGVRYMIANGKEEATVIAQRFDLQIAEIEDMVGGYPVTAIADNAFEDHTMLTDVILKGWHLHSIGRNAFKGCTSLRSFEFKDDNGLKSIGQNAFAGCDDLNPKPTIPTSFNKDGLAYQITNQEVIVTGLASDHEGNTIEIPAFVTYAGVNYNVVAIGTQAFLSQTSITSVTIGSNVKTIGEGAFERCTGLTSVTVEKGADEAPAALEKIEDRAFFGCTQLKTFTCENEVEYNDNAFEECHEELVKPSKKEVTG